MTMTTSNTDAFAARMRSAAYGMIGAGFLYPDRSLAEALELAAHAFATRDTAGARRRDVDSMAAPSVDGKAEISLSRMWESSGMVRFRVSMSRGGLNPRAVGGESGDEREIVSLERLQYEHGQLFGHAVRGTCPLYELEYGGGEIPQQASEMADIAGFYSAFGMEVSGNACERLDHVAVESEFMSALCAKEEHGLLAGNDDLVASVRRAQRWFLRDHIGRWLPALAARIADAAPSGFYAALGRFAVAVVEDQCRELDVPVGPQFLELTPADPISDATLSCGPENAPGDSRGEALVGIGVDPALASRRRTL